MLLYQYRHPKSFKFLTEIGYIPSSRTVGPLPDLTPILSALASPSSDDQKFILIPLILEVLSHFYLHQDAIFTLNEYISQSFSDYDEVSHQALLG